MKFVSKKRIASTVLAGAMALSMAAPAFAAGGNETVVTGTYNEVKIAVTVPATGKAIVNPFGLPVTMGTGTIAGEQIVTSAPLTILNKSGVDLKVGASVKATPTGTGVTLIGASDSEPSDWATETDKKIKVNFEAFAAPTLDEENATDTEVTLPLFAALKTEDALVTATGLSATAQDTTDANGGLVLRKANEDGELQKGGAGFFRLSGKAAKKPAWATTDGFTATITFSFDPAEYSKSAGTFADYTGPAAGSSVTVAFTPDLPDGVTVTKWEVTSSDKTKATVKETSTSTVAAPKIQITGVVAGGPVTVTIRGTGSDGMVYSASTSVTVSAA